MVISDASCRVRERLHECMSITIPLYRNMWKRMLVIEMFQCIFTYLALKLAQVIGLGRLNEMVCGLLVTTISVKFCDGDTWTNITTIIKTPSSGKTLMVPLWVSSREFILLPFSSWGQEKTGSFLFFVFFVLDRSIYIYGVCCCVAFHVRSPVVLDPDAGYLVEI